MDQQVTQLGPGEDHHGQISTCQCQAATQFSGCDALRRSGSADAEHGQCPQKEDPVQQSYDSTDDHGYDLRVALPDVGADRREHILGNDHGHRDTFMIVQDGFTGTDYLIFIHLVGQVGLNAGLAVDAVEGGAVCHLVGGHIDQKGQTFHGIFKTAQQWNIQLKGTVGNELRGLVGVDLYRFGNGIFKEQ